MKKIKFLSIFLSLCLLLPIFLVPTALAVTEPGVSAPSALVIDRRSGSVIYSKNADSKVYPASTTKIMTALLAVEAVEQGSASMSDQITATQSAMVGLSDLGSSAGIAVGETLTLEQLLYCAMVSSANEACNIIAEHISGDRQSFIDRMNARAAELGCTDTHFANAHGLPLLEHYTTASDLARISLEATRHPLFMEICGTAEVQIPASNKSPARELHNSNALLCGSFMYGSGYLYAGTQGIKTGHTTAAGYCLVSAAARNGVELLTLIFGDSTSDACFRDTITLYDWAFSNYCYQQLLSAKECVGTVPVITDGVLEQVELCPAEDYFILLPNDCDLSQFSREITIFNAEQGQALTGPLPPGQALGKVQLMKNGVAYGAVDLVPASVSALVTDQKTGEILFSKGADNRVYPADLTAIMTALLAVEAVEHGQVYMNDLVTASDALDIDLEPDSSRIGIAVGEMATLEYFLNCAILGTGGDACNVIAEYISGTVPAFVALMNQRAAELGCTSTCFANTHGAYHPSHYTTARDFALIAQEAYSHEQLARIFSSSMVELDETNLSPARTLYNTNPLLCADSVYGSDYLYDGATGLKAGYNAEAGYALAASAARNDIRLLCLVFGGEKTEGGYSCFNDAVEIFDGIFDNYCYQEILKSSENIASVDIALGQNSDYVNLRPSKSITVLLPKDFDLGAFQTDIRVYALENGETIVAPISAGQVLGEVTLSCDGRVYGTVKLEASSSVELSRLQYIRSQIQETTHQRSFRLTVLILALLFLLYLVWVIVYRVKRLRHRKALRDAEKKRKHAAAQAQAKARDEEAKAPDIRFFPGEGEEAAAEGPAEDSPDAPPSDNIIQLHPPAAAPKPAQPEAEAPSAEAAPDPGDLLRDAVCVATLPAAPSTPETPEEKAERDYFEEFFRKK